MSFHLFANEHYSHERGSSLAHYRGTFATLAEAQGTFATMLAGAVTTLWAEIAEVKADQSLKLVASWECNYMEPNQAARWRWVECDGYHEPVENWNDGL